MLKTTMNQKTDNLVQTGSASRSKISLESELKGFELRCETYQIKVDELKAAVGCLISESVT